jgi:hypothetical protein
MKHCSNTCIQLIKKSSINKSNRSKYKFISDKQSSKFQYAILKTEKIICVHDIIYYILPQICNNTSYNTYTIINHESTHIIRSKGKTYKYFVHGLLLNTKKPVIEIQKFQYVKN